MGLTTQQQKEIVTTMPFVKDTRTPQERLNDLKAYTARVDEYIKETQANPISKDETIGATLQLIIEKNEQRKIQIAQLEQELADTTTE